MSSRHGASRLVVVALGLAMAAAPAGAQSGGGYRLTWNTVDAGGTTRMSGAGYVLGQTSGQPDAGLFTGGGYQLRGGFWAASGGALPTDVGPGVPAATPTAFRLLPPRPNPSRDGIVVSFDLPEERPVRACVYGLGGERVRTLLAGVRPAGRHEVAWDGADESGARVHSGVYLFSITAGRDATTAKLVILR